MRPSLFWASVVCRLRHPFLNISPTRQSFSGGVALVVVVQERETEQKEPAEGRNVVFGCYTIHHNEYHHPPCDDEVEWGCSVCPEPSRSLHWRLLFHSLPAVRFGRSVQFTADLYPSMIPQIVKTIDRMKLISAQNIHASSFIALSWVFNQILSSKNNTAKKNQMKKVATPCMTANASSLIFCHRYRFFETDRKK